MRPRSALVGVAVVAALAATIGSGSSSNEATPADSTSASTAATATSFKVGQAVKLGDFTVKVLSMKDPYKSTNSFDKPAKGTRYIAIDTQVTNTGSEPRTVSSLACFDVADATGQQYTMSLVVGAPKPPDGELAPGKLLRGTLVYEIPTGQKKGLTMDFKCDLFSSGSATIALS